MTPVTQTVLHRDACDLYETRHGNCLRACLASILGIGIDDMPPFEVSRDPGDWWCNLQRWGLDERHGKMTLFRPNEPPAGYAIMSGQSPRGRRHAVVALDGEMVWDPHPSRAGLVSVDGFFAFVPVLLPAEAE